MLGAINHRKIFKEPQAPGKPRKASIVDYVNLVAAVYAAYATPRCVAKSESSSQSGTPPDHLPSKTSAYPGMKNQFMFKASDNKSKKK